MSKTNEKTSKKKGGISAFIRGTILTDERVIRQFPFVIFLVVLGFLMITNRYRSEKVIREIGALQDSIKDLKTRSNTNSTYLIQISRPSDVIEKVTEANPDLVQPLKYPEKIEVKKLKE